MESIPKKPQSFDTWQEVFDYVRKADRPLRVVVDGEIGTAFPSGHFLAEATLPPKAEGGAVRR